MLRSFTRVLKTSPRIRPCTQFTRALCAKNPETGIEDQDIEDNLLDGKATRDNLRDAFSTRCMDSIRYEYFAQRAELEAETEAASMFRSLTETAKQQAMGYMELMEEYGDADFGDTLHNLEVSAEGEKASAEGALREHGVVAGREDLDAIEEYFEDMADASEKVWRRLELASSMYDFEGIDADDMDGGVSMPEKVKN